MTVRIVYLGDSVTCGQCVDLSKRWTALIDKCLGDKAVTRNFGMNGEQTRMALERFPTTVQAEHPDVLTLQYGMNDANCWQTDCGTHRVSPAAFSANLREMIERARTFGLKRVILLTNHPTLRTDRMPNGQTYEDANRRYANIVRSAARAAPAWLVRLCDTWLAFEGKDLAPLLWSDGLHLSEAGHALYAKTVWPFISSYWEDWCK